MSALKCRCGGTYTRIPDEEVDDLPPSSTAYKFYCAACDCAEWVEPWDLGLDEWPENT